MRYFLQQVLGVLLSGLAVVSAAQAQISSFQHVVIVVQENRTPDNLFQGLCTKTSSCSAKPTSSQYNIQTSDWLDNSKKGGVTQPSEIDLDAPYDLSHTHSAFTRQCDLNASGVCLMDGASENACAGVCPSNPQFKYVDNSSGVLGPYLTMATQYGFANYMFQTNQGPSYPAHQFLFGGTSAPSTADDAEGIFVSENTEHGNRGCAAKSTAKVLEIVPPGDETQSIFPCFEHDTVPDVLPSNISWRYYAPSSGSIWTAPNSIKHICRPDQPSGGECLGPLWLNNVDLTSADVLTDIGNCALRNVSWVIPTGQNSDHPGFNSADGPAWVASVVNAVGRSKCINSDGSTYWNSTAILVTWDDWGGWYDHEPPTILALPQGDYQYGFRVPLIVISAYTPQGYIDNGRHDFGSMLRFVENNFGVSEGILTFADSRAREGLAQFFDLDSRPRPFVTIPANKSAAFFLNDKTPALDPDDD